MSAATQIIIEQELDMRELWLFDEVLPLLFSCVHLPASNQSLAGCTHILDHYLGAAGQKRSDSS